MVIEKKRQKKEGKLKNSYDGSGEKIDMNKFKDEAKNKIKEIYGDQKVSWELKDEYYKEVWNQMKEKEILIRIIKYF
jgi:hypothetical protein